MLLPAHPCAVVFTVVPGRCTNLGRQNFRFLRNNFLPPYAVIRGCARKNPLLLVQASASTVQTQCRCSASKCKHSASVPTLHNPLIFSLFRAKSARCKQNCQISIYGKTPAHCALKSTPSVMKEVLCLVKRRNAAFSFGVLPESNMLLWLTDRTDCTDSFAHATCFSTTEMTDLTDFVSIACSLRHQLVAAIRSLTT